HSAVLEAFMCEGGAAVPPMSMFPQGAAEAEGEAEAGRVGLGRSVFDLLHEQSRRLQEMGDELARARGALSERKLIERAKGLLMEHRGLTEDQAYRMLRQTAMDQGKRLVEVAEAVIGFSGFLGSEAPPRRG
ncbi:MAG: ANTAR domain-containing protein, partial [Pseudazoarcus pumilus]|nr:ANTAR domain-containing protein [Pseudazoarcus pumilus]